MKVGDFARPAHKVTNGSFVLVVNISYIDFQAVFSLFLCRVFTLILAKVLTTKGLTMQKK